MSSRPFSVRFLLLVTAALFLLAALGFWATRSRAPRASARAASSVDTTAPADTSADQSTLRRSGLSTTSSGGSTGVDFKTQLDEALHFHDRLLRGQEFGRRLRLWLEKDFAAAVAYVRALPAGSAEYSMGVLLTLDFLSQRDVDRALQLASELVKSRRESVFYNALFDRLARTDPRSATSRLALVPNGEGRANALRALTDVWSASDFSAAFAWAKTLTDSTERGAALEAALQNLAARDPMNAIALARDTLDGSALERALTTALHALTASDPSTAAAVVSQLPPSPTKTSAALEVARVLSERNPAQALTWIETLPAGDTRSLALGNAIEAWAAHDTYGARNYVSQMPAGPEQDGAATRIASILGGSTPADAIAWAQSLTAPSARSAATIAIGSAWAHNDPAAAANWASQLPTDSSVRADTLASALSYWTLQDARAAQDFVRTLDAAIQPRAAVEIAPALAQQDPASAIAWAQSLSAPAARDAATAAAYARWLDNTPDAARAWLASANLPSDLRNRLKAE